MHVQSIITSVISRRALRGGFAAVLAASMTLASAVALADFANEIVYANDDTASAAEETYCFFPCLTNEHVLVARNRRISDIVGISGEISSKDYVSDGKWTQVDGHCLTNIDGAVQMNLVCHVEDNKRRVGASIRFYQDGADIKCCTYWGGRKWDGSYVSLDEPFGALRSGAIGADLVVTNVAGVAGSIAVRNLKVRIAPTARIVGSYGNFIIREDGWVKIWDDVILNDVTNGPAWMAVNKDSVSKWAVASNYLVSVVNENQRQSYYQWQRGNTLYSIRFLMKQESGGVEAMIASAHYNWDDGTHSEEYIPGYNPGTTDGSGSSFVAVTNVENVAVSEAHDTLMISNLTAYADVTRLRTETVGADFNEGGRPVRLKNVKLALDPGEDGNMDIGFEVHGYGAVGVSSGTVALANSLPANIGLDVDSGTAKITSSIAVGGPVRVSDGAKLSFTLSGGSCPVLAAEAFQIAPGATLAIDYAGGTVTAGQSSRKYTLVSNCNYTDYALEGMEVTLPDSLKSRYTAKLVAEDNGDIAVEIARKSGLVIIMY